MQQNSCQIREGYTNLWTSEQAGIVRSEIYRQIKYHPQQMLSSLRSTTHNLTGTQRVLSKSNPCHQCCYNYKLSAPGFKSKIRIIRSLLNQPLLQLQGEWVLVVIIRAWITSPRVGPCYQYQGLVCWPSLQNILVLVIIIRAWIISPRFGPCYHYQGLVYWPSLQNMSVLVIFIRALDY